MRIRNSLSTKIILVVEAILLFSSAIFCVVSISRAQIAIRASIRQRMLDIANCAAGSVNGDILETLTADNMDSPEYKTAYDSIAVFRDNVELEYIYCIKDEGDGRFTFTVDTDPEDPASWGDEVEYTEALNRASKGTAEVDEVPYTDRWGSFYSAYSPVFDSAGRVAGIIGADFSVEWYEGQLQEQTVSNIRSYIVILAATLLGAAVLCFLIVRPFVKMQEQLLEEKVTAENANKAKSDFLANMSHEIRTPINAVLGMNEMILRESRQGRRLPAGKTKETHEAFDQIGFYANEVDSAGRSLLTIINDILDFSKIEAGRMELVRGRYRLSAVLNDVTGMIAFKAREKGLEFLLEADGSLPDNLFGDEVRVREIITNLLNNAVKYTEKGFVRLKVHGRDRVGSTVRLVFIVEDSGIGIRQEDMGKLFDKFQRLDMDRNSTVEGSGLGLTITRNLLDMMDGTISVDSEYGKGTTFTVTIPQRVVSPEPMGEVRTKAAEEKKDYREAFHAPDARILIVDDTRINLTVTASLLKKTEIRIDTALNGPDAIALAARWKYDVILMDQRMPAMDGTEALRRIRQMKDSPNAETPVICLTADAIIGARERYIAEGFSDYLTKPVEGSRLEEMLMKYLPEEKVLPLAGAEDEPEAAEERPAVPEAAGDGYAPLRAAGIDPDTGLLYCQEDRDLYGTLLSEYCREYEEKAAELRRDFSSRNWKDYSVYVHALKSSSRMLGIQDLSDTAALLEAAANAGDEEPIRQEHEPMLARYAEVVRAIRDVTEDKPEGVPAEENGDPDAGVFEFAPDETP